jgi:hypothetical protein
MQLQTTFTSNFINVAKVTTCPYCKGISPHCMECSNGSISRSGLAAFMVKPAYKKVAMPLESKRKLLLMGKLDYQILRLRRALLLNDTLSRKELLAMKAFWFQDLHCSSVSTNSKDIGFLSILIELHLVACCVLVVPVKNCSFINLK